MILKNIFLYALFCTNVAIASDYSRNYSIYPIASLYFGFISSYDTNSVFICDLENNTFKRIRSAYISNDNRFFKYVSGRIIYLLGTSSAGKTSIINELKKQHAETQNLLYTGNDDIWSDFLYEIAPVSFKGKINPIDLVYCVNTIFFNLRQGELQDFFENDKVLKRNKQLLQTKEWLDFIDMDVNTVNSMFRKYLDHVMLNVIDGKTIILDAISLEETNYLLESKFIRCQTIFVSVYSPPLTTLSHILKRNSASFESGDLEDLRLFFPFEQYYKLYIPSSTKTDFVMKKSDLLAISFKNSILSVMTTSTNISSWMKMKTASIVEKNEIIENKYFDRIFSEWFCLTDKIFLKTVIASDILLDTSILHPKESARLISSILQCI